MPPVNEPSTPSSQIVLPNISMSSPPNLIALATAIASQGPSQIDLLSKITQIVTNATLPDITPPATTTTTSVVGAPNLPIGGYDISALLTSYLASADASNGSLPPSVGSPPNPSSSLCSEPSTSQPPQQQQRTSPLMPSGPSMAHGTTADHHQNREQQRRDVGMMPMARMDQMQHHHAMPPHHHLSYMPNHFMNSNDVFSTMEMSQKQSPPAGMFKIEFAAKNEPSSSSNSQPSTPSMGDRRSVPACSICGTDSTGIHFGVDACAACSAFFRRTVVLNKDYNCNKGGNCPVVKDGSAGQKCRACRFRKCIAVGMDKNSVQHRRDAIGKYSAGVKRELTPETEVYEPPSRLSEPSTSQQQPPATCPPPLMTYMPSTPPDGAGPSKGPNNSKPQFIFIREGRRSVLHELILRQNFIVEQRQLFYAGCLGDWFKKPLPTENILYELTDYSKCMYHLWKVEPRLAADFINRNSYLDNLPVDEKLKIYRNFVVVRQSVEEPYLTWKHGGLEKRWFVMPNNTYIDFTDPEKYMHNGALKDLNLDFETTKKLFLPTFTHAMDTVAVKMQSLDVNEIELAALMGLVLLDPGIFGLAEATRKFLKGIRDQLIQDLFAFYEDEMSLRNPELRIADLFMMVSSIKIHSVKTSENMHILRLFELIPNDSCFNQMLDAESEHGSPRPEGAKKRKTEKEGEASDEAMEGEKAETARADEDAEETIKPEVPGTPLAEVPSVPSPAVKTEVEYDETPPSVKTNSQNIDESPME